MLLPSLANRVGILHSKGYWLMLYTHQHCLETWRSVLMRACCIKKYSLFPKSTVCSQLFQKVQSVPNFHRVGIYYRNSAKGRDCVVCLSRLTYTATTQRIATQRTPRMFVCLSNITTTLNGVQCRSLARVL